MTYIFLCLSYKICNDQARQLTWLSRRQVKESLCHTVKRKISWNWLCQNTKQRKRMAQQFYISHWMMRQCLSTIEITLDPIYRQHRLIVTYSWWREMGNHSPKTIHTLCRCMPSDVCTNTQATIFNSNTQGWSYCRKIEMEMSQNMTHSTSTLEMYYRNRKGGQESLEVFEKIQTLSSKSYIRLVANIYIYTFLETEPQVECLMLKRN